MWEKMQRIELQGVNEEMKKIKEETRRDERRE